MSSKRHFCHSLILLWFLFDVSLFSQKIIEQSSSNKPSWLIEPPSGIFFKYYSGIGSSSTALSGAKEQAIANLLSELIMENEINASSEINTFHQQSNAGIISEVSREILHTGETTTITGLQKEEEYWQIIQSKNGLVYQYWILMKVPKPGFEGTDLTIKQGYGVKPLIKSILVPGWGQFHKGEQKKGRQFLISETILLSSFVISNYFSQNYNDKAQSELDTDKRKFYNDWSDRAYKIGTVSGILASAIYAYNIFDAITSKGKKRYAYQTNKSLEIFAELNQYQSKIIFSISLY
jgi:hypothetical protein